MLTLVRRHQLYPGDSMRRKPFLALFFVACTLFAGARLASSQAMEGMDTPKAPSKPSTTLFVDVEGQTTSFSIADLKAMPQKTVRVHNEHTNADESYSGVLLSDLLAKCGIVNDQEHHQQFLHTYLIAEGTDKYSVLYSAVEVHGSEHNADVLVATSMDGKDLGADGQFKLVGSADKKAARWVRNLAAITVKTAQ